MCQLGMYFNGRLAVSYAENGGSIPPILIFFFLIIN